MTATLFAVGGSYLVTAAGLTGVRLPARILLAIAGICSAGIASSPVLADGPTALHLAWAVLGAITTALWPAVAGWRAPQRAKIVSGRGSAIVTMLFVALLIWLVMEALGGNSVGLAERLVSSTQTSWPFVVAILLHRATRHPRLQRIDEISDRCPDCCELGVGANLPTTGNGRLVLLGLADACSRAGGTGCWPSLATIARKANISDRTVLRVIARPGGHVAVHRGDGWAGSTNSYTVVTGLHSPGQNVCPTTCPGMTTLTDPELNPVSGPGHICVTRTTREPPREPRRPRAGNRTASRPADGSRDRRVLRAARHGKPATAAGTVPRARPGGRRRAGDGLDAGRRGGVRWAGHCRDRNPGAVLTARLTPPALPPPSPEVCG